MGKVIGVISIKGGVGKTTTVSNLGAVLAKEFGQKVLLIDGNVSAPNLGLHLGVVEPEDSVQDVLLGKTLVKDAIVEHEIGFHLLSAQLNRNVLFKNPVRLKERIDEVKHDYDLVLIDSSPNLDNEMLATMMAADELLVVTTPDYPTLSCTLQAVELAKQQGNNITGLILNMVRNKSFEITLEEIEDTVGVPVLAVIPDDARFMEALANTSPASFRHPKINAAVEYHKLGASLIGKDFHDNRFLSKIKNYLKQSISRPEINRAILRDSQLRSKYI